MIERMAPNQKGAALFLRLSVNLISRARQLYRDGADPVIGVYIQRRRLITSLCGVERHPHPATAARRNGAASAIVNLRKSIGASDADAAAVSDGRIAIVRCSNYLRRALGADLLLAEVQAGRGNLDDGPAAGKLDHLGFRRCAVDNRY